MRKQEQSVTGPIVFITPQKKNLPELDGLIDDTSSILGAYSVLRLWSNDEMLYRAATGLDGFSLDMVPDDICKALKMDSLFRVAKKFEHDFDAFDEVIAIPFATFRKSLKDMLHKEFYKLEYVGSNTDEPQRKRLTGPEILNLLQNDQTVRERWGWLEKFWPTIHVYDADVLICTSKKFVLPVDPIIDRTFVPATSALLDGSLVFMDEFDSVKADWLDVFANSTALPDLAMLVRAVFSAAALPSLPETFVRQNARELDTLQRHLLDLVCRPPGDDPAAALREFLLGDDTLPRRDTSIRPLEFIDLPYKAHNDVLHSSGLFMYDGKRSSAHGTELWVTTDTKNRLNKIVAAPPEDDTTARRLAKDMADLRSVIRYFVGFLSSVSHIESDSRPHRLSPESPLDSGPAEGYEEDDLGNFGLKSSDPDAKVESVLNLFNIRNEAERRYLINATKRRQRALRIGKSSWAEDALTLYEEPLDIFLAVDGIRHGYNTELRLYGLAQSPEAVMKDLIERSLVVGLSASATIESPLCNFDVEYLASCLPNSMLSIPEETWSRLKKIYESERCNIGATNLTIKPLEVWERHAGETDESGALLRWVDDTFSSQRLKDSVTNLLMQHLDDPYTLQRYIRVATVYQHFLQNCPEGVFIAATSPSPKEDKPRYSISTLSHLFNAIRKQMGVKDLPQSCGFISDSTNFQKTYDALIKQLDESNRRIFICASINTIGVGVNLQVDTRIRPWMKKVFIGQGTPKGRNEIDVRGIYIDDITRVAPSHHSIMKETVLEKRVQALITGAFKVREMERFGDLSRKSAYNLTEAIFSGGRHEKVVTKLSVRRASSCKAMQLLGRMDRSPFRHPTTFVYYYPGLVHKLDPYALDHLKIQSATTKMFFDEMQRKTAIGDSEDTRTRAERMASQRTNSLNRWTLDMVVRTHWSTPSIKMWQDAHLLALRNPTPVKEDFARIGLTDFSFHIKTPESLTRYRYSSDDRSFEVTFDPYATERDFPFEVSEEASGLPILRQCPDAIEALELVGAPTSWDVRGHMLNPVAFRNYYKGALGEVIGTHIINSRASSKFLVEIDDPNKFEKFDRVVAGTDVYVDFKNWSGSARAGERGWSDLAIRKLGQVGGRKAAYINLLANDDFRHSRIEYLHDGAIIVVPFLIDDVDKAVDEDVVEEIIRWLMS